MTVEGYFRDLLAVTYFVCAADTRSASDSYVSCHIDYSDDDMLLAAFYVFVNIY